MNEPSPVTPPPSPPSTPPAPPPDTSLVKTTWIVILVGWAVILIPIPFTAWIGILIAALGGSVLAIVNLTRGVVPVGIAQLLCALIGTWVVYWIGFTLMTALIGTAVLTTIGG
jgi:hypothetical protein